MMLANSFAIPYVIAPLLETKGLGCHFYESLGGHTFLRGSALVGQGIVTKSSLLLYGPGNLSEFVLKSVSGIPCDKSVSGPVC